MSNADRIILNTLGKLLAHGHGLFGYCRRCRRHFAVPLPALIAVRGADSPVVRVQPVRCAACGGRYTEVRIAAPSGAGADGATRRSLPHWRGSPLFASASYDN